MSMENRFKTARTVHNQHGSQTTKEVAAATGITKSLIEDIESTRGKPRDVGYLKVKKLSEYYGVSSDYLLGLTDTPYADEDIPDLCNGWISVKERLPDEEDEYYLICINNWIVRTGMYCNGAWNCCTGIFMTDILRPCHSVTHWMPLPEPPKK